MGTPVVGSGGGCEDCIGPARYGGETLTELVSRARLRPGCRKHTSGRRPRTWRTSWRIPPYHHGRDVRQDGRAGEEQPHQGDDDRRQQRLCPEEIRHHRHQRTDRKGDERRHRGQATAGRRASRRALHGYGHRERGRGPGAAAARPPWRARVRGPWRRTCPRAPCSSASGFVRSSSRSSEISASAIQPVRRPTCTRPQPC